MPLHQLALCGQALREAVEGLERRDLQDVIDALRRVEMLAFWARDLAREQLAYNGMAAGFSGDPTSA
jgi:hypothetical protein